MKTSGSLGKRCWRKGDRGGSSPKQPKQHATRTCNSTGTRAATHKSPPSGTSGALTSVATTGGMSLSGQPPLRQHRPPRPRSPVSEGLRRSNRRRRTTTYRPNNDDDDSDPDDVDDKKDEDYVPDDDSDPDEDLNDYVSDPDDLNAFWTPALDPDIVLRIVFCKLALSQGTCVGSWLFSQYSSLGLSLGSGHCT